MASRVTIHIGTPKSGTTFLQALLFGNKRRLAERGVLLPSDRADDHALAAIGMRNGPDDTYAERWEGLLAEVAAWDGPAIITNEWFGMAGPERTAEAVRRLDEVGEVHVVLTARDLVDQVPAAWQETLKLGDSTQIDEFVDKLDQDDFRWGWWDIDPAEVLARWTPSVPAERLHVVTIPPRGAPSEILWHRFADACGLSPEWCSAEVKFARQSLSVEAARLLQLAGPRLLDAIDATPPPWNGPRKWIQSHLSHGILLDHRGGRITMSPERIADVRARSGRSVAAIEGFGCAVHGDLADLTSSRLPEGATHPDDVPDAAVLDLAIDVIAEQLGRARKVANRAQAAPRTRAAQAPRVEPSPAAPATVLRRALGRARRAVRGD
ncbi:hypothetical protein [Isoptericola sp. NPDC019482]|uniref:hypothetical protein n=1 Tax=Isoptericola sp. NPDC019482 TaxID=3154688 RepID=UPI0034786F81